MRWCRSLISAQLRHGETSAGQHVPVWEGAALHTAMALQPICGAELVPRALGSLLHAFWHTVYSIPPFTSCMITSCAFSAVGAPNIFRVPLHAVGPNQEFWACCKFEASANATMARSPPTSWSRATAASSAARRCC